MQVGWARKLRDRDGVFAGVRLVMCVVCERRKSQSDKELEIYDRVTGSSILSLEVFDFTYY